MLISQRHGDAISNEMVRMAILLGVTVSSRVLLAALPIRRIPES